MSEHISTAGGVMPRVVDISQRPIDGFSRANAMWLGGGPSGKSGSTAHRQN